MEKVGENEDFRQILFAVPDSPLNSPARFSQLLAIRPEDLVHPVVDTNLVNSLDHLSPKASDAIDAECDYVTLDAIDLALPLPMDPAQF